MVEQLQAFLDGMNCLDPFQSMSRPGHGTELALVALMDDLYRERVKGRAILLLLDNISAAFNTIDRGILLHWLHGMGTGGTVLE